MTAFQAEALVRVGSITKPHGIKGEVIVYLESDFPKWVAKRKTLVLETATGFHATDVLQSRFHQGKLVIKLAALPDRNAAEAARGKGLFVLQDEAREPFEGDKDYFLNAELMGLVLYDERAPEQALGEIVQIYDLPMQQVIEIKKADGSTFLVPFVAAIVKQVLPQEGRVLACLPEGLDTLEQDNTKEG